MKQLLIVATMVFVLGACDKNMDDSINVKSTDDLAGTFSGNFHRTGMDTAGVTIFFDKTWYQGRSMRPNYPAICAGRFELNGSTISFTDTCSWTANFDWSLILDGTYNINFTSDSTIVMWRTNGNIKDEYRLTRPFR